MNASLQSLERFFFSSDIFIEIALASPSVAVFAGQYARCMFSPLLHELAAK